jgi:[ribosomal protein S18]-alanine N-acetyltransferase
MIAPSDHVDQIMAVMAAAFDPAFGEAWNRRQVEDALLVGNCRYLLMAADGTVPAGDAPVAGFCLSRAGYREEELLLFAVDPVHRRRGLGGQLLEQFAFAAQSRGAEQLLLEMRRGNPAESLYRAFGFSPIGERRNYYRLPNGDRFDAITFMREVPAS